MAELNVPSTAAVSISQEKLEEPDNAAPSKAADMYGNMKLLSQSMLDMALLLSNVSELVQVLKIGEQQEFYIAATALLSTSIILQVLVGIALLLTATSSENTNSITDKKHKEVGLMNRLVMVGVFLITVINVFISAISFKQTSDIETDGKVVTYRKSANFF